jgi:hypothetical protein
MVATAILLPVALYTVVISIYKFYLFIAGMVSAEYKELIALCSMAVLAVGLTRFIANSCVEHDIKDNRKRRINEPQHTKTKPRD